MPARRVAGLVALTTATLLAATPSASAASALPTPDHVLVVMMENKDPGEVLDDAAAPYLSALARAGASFTDAHAETHPSQPNYLALFSGSTQGVTDDGCDHTFGGPNLGSALIAAGRTFVGYAEGLPRAGATVCTAGRYARKHSPWVNFTDVSGAATNQPAAMLNAGWDHLPTVAFLTPDLCHDMHDCPVAAGDAWAKDTLGSYLDWARTHNGLLVLTFDESEPHTPGNPIATVLAGPMVTPGAYPGRIDHYTLLRTIEDMYGLAPLGASAHTAPITGIWRTGASEGASAIGGTLVQSGAATRGPSTGPPHP